MNTPLYAEGEPADPALRRKTLLRWEEFEMPGLEFLAEIKKRINAVPKKYRKHIVVWCDYDDGFIMLYDPDLNK